MLNFDPSWRLMSPGKIASGVIHDLTGLIRRVAGQHGNRQHIVEHYKGYFADAANRPHHHSSSLSWAETDLDTYMHEAGENAPLFVEAFYDAGEALKRQHEGIVVPDVTMINHVLNTHDAGYEVNPPQLIARRAQMPVEIETLPPSLDAQAHEKIQRSLKQSEEYLTAGKNRQAVQEILWLLETVSTVFQGLPVGDGTIQGKYFNKIADELKLHRKGQVAEQAINWMKTLHGYLSSPTGGGVRHGATLTAEGELSSHEARLICNLIRSYLSFLLDEYDQFAN
ncbi:hypothetical protein [Bradyrhizobium septentrionale]|uniref:Abortive infection protein-like C-terminal domain-containing protein n=1 Tax=Bradyrhizobium septentrionale TaxID=1404411 RepID=A0ABZ2PBZ4_9BRAD